MPGEYRRRELTENVYTVIHTVDNSHDGSRVDLFLKKCFRTKSRAFIQRSIDDGTIELSPRQKAQTPRLKASTVLISGDEIKVHITRDRPEPIVDFNYDILFEDDDLLVINKTGNLPVHPAGRFFFNTLLTHLRTVRAEDVKQGKDFYLVHRIDRETSGVMVIAKKSAVARALVAQFYDHEVIKQYYAVVMGRAPQEEFVVEKNMKNDDASSVRLKMKTCDSSEGMTAKTRFRVVARGPRFDLLECFPETGRQHQIRVHLASEGLPLVGDKLYAGYDHLFLNFIYDGIFTDEMMRALHSKRHALHAHRLAFRHPVSHEMLTFSTPLPKDLQDIFNV